MFLAAESKPVEPKDDSKAKQPEAVDDKKPEEPKDDGKKKLKKTKSEISEPEIKPAETQPPADQEKPMSELEKRRAEMEKRKKEQAELEGLFRLHCFLNKFTSFKNI